MKLHNNLKKATIALWCLIGHSAHAEILRVNSTLDDSAYDSTISASINPPGQPTVITLRSALERSFDNGTVEDLITFSISKKDPGYQPTTKHWIIEPESSYLPVFGKKVIIDGFSQRGAKPNTNKIDEPNNSCLKIELRGQGPGMERDPALVPDGIDFLFADGSEVKGLIVNNFARYFAADDSLDDFGSSGIAILFSNNCSLTGCFFGTDVTGTQNLPNLNAFSYLQCTNSSIGGSKPCERNLFSGSYTGLFGIININTCTDISIKGNTVGPDRTGNQIIQPDGRIGINLQDSERITIGGDSACDRNVVSGSRTYNILCTPISKTLLGADYVIKNNYIGTNLKGNRSFGERNGLGIVGAQTTGLRIEENLISGNGKGISLGFNGFAFLPCENSTIQKNIIGLNAQGEKALGNELHGILLGFAQKTLISENVISANGGNGIQTGIAEQTSIVGNRIGTNKNGKGSFGNGHNGIQLGTLVAAGIPSQNDTVTDNLIAHNVANGIEIRSHAINETIQHNCITKNNENGILIACSEAILANNRIRDNGGESVVISGVVKKQ